MLVCVLQGIMTHMTDVKPLIAVATYVDDDTGFEVYQTVTGAAPSSLLKALIWLQWER